MGRQENHKEEIFKRVPSGRPCTHQDVQPHEVRWLTSGPHLALQGYLPILNKVRAQAYKVELPPKFKYHFVFHVDVIKPYHRDQVDPNRGISQRALMGIQVQHDKEVDEVITNWVIRHFNQPPTHELLVMWKGLPESEASCQPIQHLW